MISLPARHLKQTKVVCFGGGTGLSTLLSGLKFNPLFSLSAVVTMFDNGGSSGRLRDQFGILPPGDIMKCMVALSRNPSATRDMLLRRVTGRPSPDHSVGNMLVFSLKEVYGDFMVALRIFEEILQCDGSVFPVALTSTNLAAQFGDNTTVGEHDIDLMISRGKRPAKLFLNPPVQANEEALRAIKDADAICIGPGSFYTSLIPNFLPEGVKEILADSSQPIIFIQNLLTEGDGMRDHTSVEMTRILEEYIGRPVTNIIVNTSPLPPPELLYNYERERKRPISLFGIEGDERYVGVPLWVDSRLARHDTRRLAYALSHVIWNALGERG